MHRRIQERWAQPDWLIDISVMITLWLHLAPEPRPARRADDGLSKMVTGVRVNYEARPPSHALRLNNTRMAREWGTSCFVVACSQIICTRHQPHVRFGLLVIETHPAWRAGPPKQLLPRSFKHSQSCRPHVLYHNNLNVAPTSTRGIYRRMGVRPSHRACRGAGDV